MKRITTWALAGAGALGALASPAQAGWQVAQVEGGMAAFETTGTTAVTALIIACRGGEVQLLVNLPYDPETQSRELGFKSWGSNLGSASFETFVRDPQTGVWITRPSAQTLALFNEQNFTLSVLLNRMSIAGFGMAGYDGELGVDAALRQALAQCPNWRSQTSGAPKLAAAKGAPAQPAPKPAAMPAAVKPLGIVPGYYVDEYSSCSQPGFDSFFYDGKRWALLRGGGDEYSQNEIGPIGKVSRFGKYWVLDDWGIQLEVASPTRIQPTIQDTGGWMRWCPADQIPTNYRVK